MGFKWEVAPTEGACGVYCIRNVANGKLYVGSSAHLSNRLAEHMRLLEREKHSNRYLQASWKKYGAESFVIEILEFVDADQQYAREQHYLDTLQPEYNLSSRAIGFSGTHTEKSRKRASMAMKAYWNRPDTREKHPKSMLGRKPSEKAIAALIERNRNKLWVESIRQAAARRRGQRVSEEIRAKISSANKGRQVSEETRLKISDSLRGHQHSEESKRKMAEAATGRKLSIEVVQRRNASIQAAHARRSPEERSAATRRSWETRRKKVG